jgi:hypothetical protein
MTPGVLQDKGLSSGYHLPAEGEGDGCDPAGGPGLGEAYGALEELVVVGDQ